MSVRQLYEKVEVREVNSHSTFPALGSDICEVGLPSVVVRPSLLCPTEAPALKPPCLVVSPQDSKVPPLCLNLHSKNDQLLIPTAEKAQKETPFSTTLAALA